MFYLSLKLLIGENYGRYFNIMAIRNIGGSFNIRNKARPCNRACQFFQKVFAWRINRLWWWSSYTLLDCLIFYPGDYKLDLYL